MTNFKNPKPSVGTSSTKYLPIKIPVKTKVDLATAIEDAIKIIRENKKIIDQEVKSSDANLQR